MTKIVVIYERPANEHNVKTFAVLEAPSPSTIMIAKAIKEYGLGDDDIEDAEIYLVKEKIEPATIRLLMKTL